jgi:hypothetical protein
LDGECEDDNFWDIAPCILALMEAELISETSVYFFETTWRYIPYGYHLQANYYLRFS